jgi:hypothetical protein
VRDLTRFGASVWTLDYRSDKAGKVLADVLLKGGQGSRYVIIRTLVGVFFVYLM